MKRVLLTMDGSSATSGALRMIEALARDRCVEAEVLAVVEPLARSIGAFSAALPHAADVERLRRSELLARIEGLVSQDFAGRAPPSVSVLSGPVAATIADAARERGADLVVLGRRIQAIRGRFGHTTAMEVLALSGIPVLSAAPSLRGLPRKAVAAVDFGEASGRAARAALDLLSHPGRLSLLHVIPPLDFPAALLWGWDESWTRRVPQEFERLQAVLGDPEGIEITTDISRSDPAAALLSRISAEGVDLIAAGSHGYAFRDRVFAGSLAIRLLAEAPCSVLLHPPARKADDAAAPEAAAVRAAAGSA